MNCLPDLPFADVVALREKSLSTHTFHSAKVDLVAIGARCWRLTGARDPPQRAPYFFLALALAFAMPPGWTVVVRRRDLAIERELWDCAISNPTTAEKVVRRACGRPVGSRAITALNPLTASDVAMLGLKEGEVRRRSTG